MFMITSVNGGQFFFIIQGNIFGHASSVDLQQSVHLSSKTTEGIDMSLCMDFSDPLTFSLCGFE